MLPSQTFQLPDIGIVAFLVLLEALLSADNALVLAIMVRPLPKPEQKRALFYGLGGAFLFRFVAILFAKQVLLIWWLQGLGAAYLLWMPVAHFRSKSRQAEVKPIGKGFWMTVFAVELSDIAFAIDSVLAGVALIKSPAKIWVVFSGAAIGIVLLRFAANVFIKLLARYALLDDVAYALVGWVGVKLAFTCVHNFGMATGRLAGAPEMSELVFWFVMSVILGTGSYLAMRKGHKEDSPMPLQGEEQENG